MSLQNDLLQKVGIDVGWTAGKPHPVMTEIPVFPAAGIKVGATTLTESALNTGIANAAAALDDVVNVAANTAAGTSFGGTGANVEAVMNGGTRTFAANTLSAGCVIKGRLVVTIPTTVSDDTLDVKLRLGGLSGTTIFTTSAEDWANSDNVVLDYEIVIRTSTTAYASVIASVLLGGTPVSYAINTAITGLTLTASLTLVATGVWSTENANSATVQHFTATVTKPA